MCICNIKGRITSLELFNSKEKAVEYISTLIEERMKKVRDDWIKHRIRVSLDSLKSGSSAEFFHLDDIYYVQLIKKEVRP